MPQTVIDASALRPGDRFITPDPEDTWPTVSAVGEPSTSGGEQVILVDLADGGTVEQILGNQILVDRPDDPGSSP
jgi:hypothetical protein